MKEQKIKQKDFTKVELKKMPDGKSAALKKLQRELEIEAALEKVRSRTMAMQKSDELSETTAVLFQQMNELGNTPERLNIGIIKEDNGYVETWATEQGGHQIKHSFNARLDESTTIAKMYEGWKAKKTSMIVDISGNELRQWIHFLQDELKMPVKEELLQNRRVQSVAYFKQGFILMTTPEPLPAETIYLLERFAKVFEQTYTRFNDLQKAEAQAREAQIELGLERVRAKAMAMHSSVELKEVVKTLFEELTHLDVNLQACLIATFDAATFDQRSWMIHFKTNVPYALLIPYNEQPFYHEMLKAWKERNPNWTYMLQGETKIKWQDFLFADTEFRLLPQAVKEGMQKPEKVFFAASYYNYGAIQAAGSEPFSKQSIDILQRFSKVFDSSYTRFLDLKKAEAQARESQIELALERVRARTMAMHKSEELAETAEVLYHQLKELGDDPERITIGILNEDNGIITWWATDQGGSQLNFRFQATIDEPTVMLKLYNSWKAKNKSLVIDLTGKELSDWVKYCREVIGVPIKEELLKNRRVQTAGFFSHGWVMITSPEPRITKTINILERFASVFNLTYRRFLDLQKAEAQTRESQIQLALERVRARTIAMQKSDELKEVIQLILEQFVYLGLETEAAGFMIDYKESNDINVWVSSPRHPLATQIHIPYFDHPIFKLFVEAKEKGFDFYTVKLTKEEKDTFFTHIFQQLPGFPEEWKQQMYAAPGYADSHVMLNNIALYIQNYTGIPYSDVDNAILTRFAKAFEQTYTRFLDLQKAETQAKEAKIEVALERVRARTMAMYKSENLSAVAEVVFTELEKLELGLLRCGIGIINKEKRSADAWITSVTDEGKTVQVSGTESMDLHPLLQGVYNAWLTNSDFSYLLEGEDLVQYYKTSGTGKVRLPDSQLILSAEKITTQYYHIAVFEAGGLFAFSANDFPEEAKMVMKRFAAVFNQSYTRFLDLQKAEAQARESQIQLALERVRARTMAMQKSEELQETSAILFEQMKALGEPVDQLSIGIVNEAENVVEISATLEGKKFRQNFRHSSDEPFVMSRIVNAWKSQQKSITIEQSTEELEAYNKFRNELTDSVKFPTKLQPGDRRILYVAFFSKGMLGLSTADERPKESLELLERFAQVFDLTYTRFLDLKNAEAQAREAKIETALERVRSRTMAMQKSEELKEIINVVYEQLVHSNIPVEHTGFIMDYKKRDDMHIWLADKHAVPFEVTIPYFDCAHWNSFNEAKATGNDFFANHLSFEEKNKFYQHLFKLFPVPDEAKEYYFSCPGLAISTVLLDNVGLYIENFSGIPYTDEDNNTLMRFGKVFQQTYTRFLDLQKAEAQAREAQIELGLERVRARAMAMQKSDELKELIGTVFTELIKLDLALTRSVIWIFDAETNGTTWWMANSEDPENPMDCYIPYSHHPPYLAFLEQWKKRSIKFQYELKGENKKNWDDYLFSKTGLARLPGIVIEGMKAPEKVWLSASFNNFGAMNAASLDPLSDEHFDILLRFAKVFDLTYTRFNDLKQAEAQAREATIEAALERVRSKTMGMHKSTDLLEVIGVLSEQFLQLGFKIHSANFNTSYREKDWNLWLYNPGTPMYPDQIYIPYLDNPFFNRTLESIANGADFTAFVFTKEEKDRFLDHIYANTLAKNAPEERKNFSYNAPGFAWSTVYLKNTALTIANYDAEPYSEEQNSIIRRFGNVFEQSYTRFLDLQKAEAQAKEAQIEASLERVRGKAMSMHSSRDLADTIDVFYHEMELLSITPRRCGVGLMDKETHNVELSTMNTTEQGESIEIIGKLKLAGHPILEGVYDNWILQKEYHPVLRGNEIKKYYQLIRPQIAYPDYPTDTAQYGYFFFFNEGGVYAWTEKELSEDELKIYRRFTSVLSLTYKRYKDLKDAEANTREAVKRASLDRVRAETASMRTTGDLEKITPLIWNELTTLNVPFIRCGVFIMDEQQELIHSFLSTPDGKAIAAFQLPYHSARELSKVLAHWHKKEIYKDHWNEATFAAWTKSLVEQGAIASEEKYSTAHRPVRLDLHFLPFLQGMLYVGSEAPLSEEEINLVQTLADAFSTAYARYEDFNKLESAKKQIEKTLVDLKQAQAQLVQSEKMASLGELTAGIAHEIQNPLNFVNNFSEVNTELIDEMKNELANGNSQQAMELADNIKENEQKINHHGKRAGDIVKGMLQHSRTSTGVKEPTNINALADEYLRLSYHGLRAKDKNFNAEMKTDFDESIGKINIIPQDIGRVLLNLYNNAFYACNERSRSTVNEEKSGNPISYNPTVSVSTKKSDTHVIITVSDNGNGIPQKIVDKIFQPFFTTKPTGSGTGLGLSLSYDIVKAHGGEIKVESKESEGTEFIIQLPVV